MIASSGSWTSWLGIVLIGLGMGGVGALTPLVIADTFGLREFGSIMGLTRMPVVIPVLVGPIMAGTIGDVLDGLFVLAHHPQDAMGQLEIRDLGVCSDVVDLAFRACLDHEMDRRAVIVDVEPIPLVEPVAVQRDLATRSEIGHEQRDDLLRELVRTVVVRASGDDGVVPIRHAV